LSLCFRFLSHAAGAVLYISFLGSTLGAGAAEPRASQRPNRTESISPNFWRQRSARSHFFQLAMKIGTVDISPPFQLSAVYRRPSPPTGTPLLNLRLPSTFAIKTALQKRNNWTNVLAIPSYR